MLPKQFAECEKYLRICFWTWLPRLSGLYLCAFRSYNKERRPWGLNLENLDFNSESIMY